MKHINDERMKGDYEQRNDRTTKLRELENKQPKMKHKRRLNYAVQK